MLVAKAERLGISSTVAVVYLDIWRGGGQGVHFRCTFSKVDCTDCCEEGDLDDYEWACAKSCCFIPVFNQLLIHIKNKFILLFPWLLFFTYYHSGIG